MTTPTIKTKEKTKLYGCVFGCERCGQMRSLVRRYGFHMCRQCFRDTAATSAPESVL